MDVKTLKEYIKDIPDHYSVEWLDKVEKINDYRIHLDSPVVAVIMDKVGEHALFCNIENFDKFEKLFKPKSKKKKGKK